MSWFLMIAPKYAEASEVREQTGETNTQLAKMRRELSTLKADNANLAKYRAQLKAYEKALPSTSGVPDFLRQLQDAGADVNVEVSGISVAAPKDSETVKSVSELPISLTAEGSADNLSRFLVQLQNVQPRAVLITSANLTGKGESGAAGDMSVAIGLTAFVTPAPGTTAVVATK